MVKALTTKTVVTMLAALALTIGVSFAYAVPAKADTVSDLQAQVQALLAQIQALQGSSTTTTTSTSAGCYTFTQNLKMGATGGQVMWVQQFLNNHGFTVAATGAGSPGNETSYFGPATNRAVIAFQNAYASSILTPEGLTSGTGNWYAATRAEANALCTSSTTTTTTGTGGTTTTTGTGITITAGTQPANSLAPQLANRVPFTTFTITNTSGAAVTINGIMVQRTGLAADAAFAGVVLIDQNGIQIGTSRTFNSNHQAEVGTPWTLAAGASMTYTIAGNMAANEAAYAGQVASLAVTGVDTSVPVSGSLPITGASQTINASLSIGTATAQISSYDPNGYRTESIGTTGVIFSGIRITAGSAENQKLYSITWNESGSAGSSDVTNLQTMVGGTAYPVTVDSTGKYYTSTFPGGITITEGNSIDAYIQGDITGNTAAGRTVEFDIYRASDIYLVGQTYGYGITPTPNTTTAFVTQSSTADQTRFTTSGSPFMEGSLTLINPGTLSTISSAGSVGAQNIAVNVPNQPLGGFTTNFTGEPVTVQSLSFTISSSSGATQLKSVSLVDSNGNVVAGPVDASGNTITFNTAVTFPVGVMTYTLKGTVASPVTPGANNGTTYQLSTNPSNWTNAQGQTSGSNVTLPNSTITFSTMTVQTGSLVVTAASTPASTTVAPGANNFTIANINLDASQSGENIRLNSLPIVITATSTTASTALQGLLSNCQLFNGTTALNSQSIGSGQWTTVTNTGIGSNDGLEANFIFQNSLTIPKGTVVSLALVCNVSSSISSIYGGAFSGGVSQNYTPSPTGASSGNTISATVTSTVSGTMTPGSASLAISAPTPTSYAQVAGGTTGVTVGTFTLQPTSDTVNLQNIGLALNSNYASSSDLARAYVYNSSGTQVGSVIFTGSPVAFNGGNYYLATSSIVTGTSIPQNSQQVFTIKADINQIGTGQAAMSGHEIKIAVADAQGVGNSSGSAVNSGTIANTGNGLAIFRSYPTIALSSYLPSNGVSDGRLIAFSVTANSNNPIGLDKLTFTTATGTASVSAVSLYAYTDSGFSNPAGGTTNGLATTTSQAGNVFTASFTNVPLEIPAGNTEYFLLKGTVSGCGSTCNVATTLNSDGTDLAPVMSAATALVGGNNFVWSPNSTTTSANLANDWTNGYGVSGLPSIGITQNRTQ